MEAFECSIIHGIPDMYWRGIKMDLEGIGEKRTKWEENEIYSIAPKI